MSSAKPVLYSFWKSSASWRVRIVLHHKEIDYEYVPINLLKSGGGEQKSAEYMKKNPAGRVPLLLIDGY